jgi:hypothetical protein
MQNNKTVTIHIDKKKYDSLDPTTGSALYALGGINAEEYELYEEVHGQGDDLLIPNDSTSVDVKNGMHFFTVKKHITPGSSRL